MFKPKNQGGESVAPLINTRMQQVQLFAEGMERINAGKTLAEITQESINTAKLLTNADAGDLLLIHGQTGNLSIHYCMEEETSRLWGIPKEISQWVVRSGQPYCTGLTGKQNFESFEGEPDLGCANILCVPLIGGDGQVIGVIQTANRRKEHSFEQNDIIFLDLFARHAAGAICSAKEKESLRSRAEESEMLLSEIHHRLKNNLSIITSLIELEYPDVNDPKAKDILKKCSSRIKTVTEVHNLLYRLGTLQNIDLETYFRKITAKISEMLHDGSEKIDFIIEADPVEVSSEQTMTCGLILNELIMNAYKHAFTSVREGKINIRISESPKNVIRIEVSDNGKGIARDAALSDDDSKGLWMVRALADRIDASVEVCSDEGTRYMLTFEK